MSHRTRWFFRWPRFDDARGASPAKAAVAGSRRVEGSGFGGACRRIPRGHRVLEVGPPTLCSSSMPPTHSSASSSSAESAVTPRSAKSSSESGSAYWTSRPSRLGSRSTHVMRSFGSWSTRLSREEHGVVCGFRHPLPTPARKALSRMCSFQRNACSSRVGRSSPTRSRPASPTLSTRRSWNAISPNSDMMRQHASLVTACAWRRLKESPRE